VEILCFDPLSFVAFPDYPHDLPAGDYLKRLPRFAGKFGVSTEDHLADFLTVVEDFDVEHEDVVMRMFVSTLEGEARNGTSPFLMPPLMDGIHSKRSSLKMGE
jgi:hypothetical protein